MIFPHVDELVCFVSSYSLACYEIAVLFVITVICMFTIFTTAFLVTVYKNVHCQSKAQLCALLA